MDKITTRSDVLFAKIDAKTIEDKDKLINALHDKIEEVYTVYFGIRKYSDEHDEFTPLADLLEKALKYSRDKKEN